MSKRRVLIVDDEPGFTRLAKLNLEQTGRYEVCEVHRGAQALEAARAFHPDVVVLDMVMPDLDGGEVAARLPATHGGRAMPVVFVSAMPKPKGVSHPFLSKPVSIEVLVASIEQACAQPRRGR